MGFVKGDRIEVEKRHLGSYRPAIVVHRASPSSYLVRYENSIAEVVAAEAVRRSPPWIPATRYARNDRVDALDDGAWWSGTVTRKKERSSGNYYVRCDISGVEISYNVSKLRFHLDLLDNGSWVYSSPTAQKMGSS